MLTRIVDSVGIIGVIGIIGIMLFGAAAFIGVSNYNSYQYHAKCYSNGTVIFDANVKKKSDYFITQDDTVVYLPEKDCVLVRIK